MCKQVFLLWGYDYPFNNPQKTSLTIPFFHLLTLNRLFPSHLEMFYVRAMPSHRQQWNWFGHKPSPAPCWLTRGEMSFNEQDEKTMKSMGHNQTLQRNCRNSYVSLGIVNAVKLNRSIWTGYSCYYSNIFLALIEIL